MSTFNQLEKFRARSCFTKKERKNREQRKTRLQQRQSGEEEAARQGLSRQEGRAQVKSIRVATTITGPERQEVKQPKPKENVQKELQNRKSYTAKEIKHSHHFFNNDCVIHDLVKST